MHIYFTLTSIIIGCLLTVSSANSDDIIKITSGELKELRPETGTVLAFFSKY